MAHAKGRKIGNNKVKCARYITLNRKEVNKRNRLNARVDKLKRRHPDIEYKTHDGKIIRKRKIYREDDLKCAVRIKSWYVKLIRGGRDEQTTANV